MGKLILRSWIKVDWFNRFFSFSFQSLLFLDAIYKFNAIIDGIIYFVYTHLAEWEKNVVHTDVQVLYLNVNRWLKDADGFDDASDYFETFM